MHKINCHDECLKVGLALLPDPEPASRLICTSCSNSSTNSDRSSNSSSGSSWLVVPTAEVLELPKGLIRGGETHF